MNEMMLHMSKECITFYSRKNSNLILKIVLTLEERSMLANTIKLKNCIY